MKFLNAMNGVVPVIVMAFGGTVPGCRKETTDGHLPVVEQRHNQASRNRTPAAGLHAQERPRKIIPLRETSLLLESAEELCRGQCSRDARQAIVEQCIESYNVRLSDTAIVPEDIFNHAREFGWDGGMETESDVKALAHAANEMFAEDVIDVWGRVAKGFKPSASESFDEFMWVSVSDWTLRNCDPYVPPEQWRKLHPSNLH